VKDLAVMIVANHPIMRDGLRRLFHHQTDMKLVCELHDAAQVLTAFSHCQPDILLIDLQLPGGEAQRAIDAVRAVAPLVPIVVLTTYPWEGANLYPDDPGTVVVLSKTAPGDEVIAAIRQAAQKGDLQP
jgi:DNA-binding NarL/FixJ family response regulator